MKFRRLALLVLIPAAAAAEDYIPGSPVDPRVREADFLAADNHYLAASTLLGRMAEGDNPGSHLSSHYLRPYADDLLAFGMRERAAEILQRVAETAASPDVTLHTRLKSAEFDYQHGNYDSAAQQLAAIRSNLPPELLRDWQSLYSRVLMAQGRFPDALGVLPKVAEAPNAPYLLFNLGVAQLNQGQIQEGRAALDHVGQMDTIDDEMLSLRDKANLVLGYDYLRSGDGRAAVPVFERVREEGPFSNRALLGLGWAQLAQLGAPQGRTAADQDKNAQAAASSAPANAPESIRSALPESEPEEEFYKRANVKPIQLPPGAGARATSLKRALVPWVELIGRDPMDPAVQEGMLAIPYSLEKLGASAQAEQFYTRAIEAMEETRRHLDTAIANVRNGRMLDEITRGDANDDNGWMWRLRNLPDASGTFYLRDLLAQIRFQEVLKNYRDSRLLLHTLDTYEVQLNGGKSGDRAQTLQLLGRIDGLRPQIDNTARLARQQIEAMALTELQTQRKIAETYIVEARLALARLYDNGSLERRK
jgi:tetratricopeptide (TPR) repeat protein